MTKFASFEQYPEGSLAQAEAALLTVWRSLEIYHSQLVLIGGLAVRYLTKKDVKGLPGAVTMDVDFGVALGAEGSQYDTISDRLSGLGFARKQNRFEKIENGTSIFVDLLTEVPGRLSGGVMVNDAPASVIPGVNRALDCHRIVPIQGRNLHGVEHSCSVRVTEIGPLLALKLNAFGGNDARRAGKDAYDVLLAVTGFVDGVKAALAGFRAEKSCGNTAMAAALDCLKRDFTAVNQDGPARAADFHGGTIEDRQRVMQDMVTVGQALLDA
jgi:hypothetical protein